MSAQPIKNYKYFIYFVAAFISCYLTQQILWNRLVSLGFGYYITGGTFVYFTSPLIIDVVSEVYGYRAARQLLWCGLFSLLFLALCVALCFTMPYPVFWTKVINAYNVSLGSMTRVAVAGAVAIFLGQLINAYLISKWKILTRGKYFWLRSLGSSIIGDSTTVLLSNTAILLGRAPTKLILANLIPELIIMLVFTALGAIPATFLAKKLAKAEGLSNDDLRVNFNPFKFGEIK